MVAVIATCALVLTSLTLPATPCTRPITPPRTPPPPSLSIVATSGRVVLHHPIPLREDWYRHSLKHDKVLLTREAEIELGVAVSGARQLEAARKRLEVVLGRQPTPDEWATYVSLASPEVLSEVLRRGAAAHRDLVEKNIRLVYTITGKYVRGYSTTSVAFEDIAQEGTLGLMRAANQWDPKRGVRFSTFAWKAIRNAVVAALTAESSPVSVPASALYSVHTMRAVEQRVRSELGREPTAEELSTALGVSPRRLATIGRAARMASPACRASLDAPRHGRQTGWLETVESNEPEPAEQLETTDGAQWAGLCVQTALVRTLTEKERRIVAWRFGLRHDDGSPAEHRPDAERKSMRTPLRQQTADRSIKEVAKEAGLSHARTSEVLQCALQKLRRSHYATELRESLEDFNA